MNEIDQNVQFIELKEFFKFLNKVCNLFNRSSFN